MADKLVMGSDGRLTLQIKPHTIRKLKVLEYYLDEFSTAMKPTGRTTGFRGFRQRNYIDLFAGPGRCLVSGQLPRGLESDGSPLIALKVKYPFSGYYFVDADHRAIEALAQRVAGVAGAKAAKKRYFEGDCDEKVVEVLLEIDTKNSINVALIDSFTIACKWSTIRALASCRRMDLIITFPQGMAINRNLRSWVKDQSSVLDEFFGNRKWRDIYDRAQGIASRCTRGFLDLYEQGLSELEYRVGDVREVLITSQKGTKLYYLIFASRSPLGERFWRNAIQVADGAQLRMFD